MRASAVSLLVVLGLFGPRPDGSTMRATVTLQLDEQKSVSVAYQTLGVEKRGEKPPNLGGPEEANWRVYALAFAAELKTSVPLKVGEHELLAGAYGFFLQPRDEGGMRLVLFDGPKSRPIELELSRSPIEHRFLTLGLAPSAEATFELTVAWGKDLGRVRFWTK